MMKLTQLLRELSAKMGTRFIIILIVLTAISTIAGAVWLVILMKPAAPPPQIVQKGDCASCHAEIFAGWHMGAHGDMEAENALAQSTNCVACHKDSQSISTDAKHEDTSTFSDFWVKEGMPNNCLSCHVTGYNEVTNTWKSDGIACEACHGVIPDDHPDAIVTINKSTENCGTCHTDDRFDLGKWENSVHFQNSMACVDCHNPHTTSLKIRGEAHNTPSQICGNCHEKLAESSEHSIHTKIGVTCTDCHLGATKGNDDFHQIPDHDFKAKIETCNKCHIDQMHFAGESTMTRELRFSSQAKAEAHSKLNIPIKTFPVLVSSSIGFTAVALLFGIIGGAALRKSVRRKKQ